MSEMRARILDTMRTEKAFLVTSHMNPEGDAIGSALAMAISLKTIGKEVTVYNQDPIPENLRFLPMSDAIVYEVNNPCHFDVAVILDCADLSRLGKDAKKIEEIKKTINIDHHKTNDGFGDLVLVDPDSSSTAEIIYGLIKDIPVRITQEIATNIYTGILTDTGAFCYSNTSAEVLEIASELVRKGVNPSFVAEEVYERQSVSKLRLLGSALNTLEILDNGRIGSMKVSLPMLMATGATPDLTENMVNYPKSIRGVEVAVLFRELSKDHYKVSLRSSERVDVADVAKEFGGGGHAKASGCIIRGNLPEVEAQVFNAINKRLVQ
ncbi:MAG: bifunctional oligoribonuclease/PAP phosphatase NrnA [Thermodesulfobacteriota bacterium]|nr:bifunctional oligoribonuclease/PAP phosphatase NrnA [Thermodesulfobacteriota bacterium]